MQTASNPATINRILAVHEFPDTQASLLMNIRDPANARSWSVFSELYRPVVYRMARRRGLQDADAQDLAQQVLFSVARSIHKWESDPDQPRFRNWLSRVTHNAIIDVFRRTKPDAPYGGSSVIHTLKQSLAADDTEIEYEYERALFRQAAQRIHREFNADTWAAFWQTTVDGRTVQETAAKIGRSVGAIYTARSRVMNRLKEVVAELKQ